VVDLTNGGAVRVCEHFSPYHDPEYTLQAYQAMRQKFAIELLDAIEHTRHPVVVLISEERRTYAGTVDKFGVRSVGDSWFPAGNVDQIIMTAELFPVETKHVMIAKGDPAPILPNRDANIKERIKFLFTGKA
jgi:fructose/tagatose bisphosphate aldolase